MLITVIYTNGKYGTVEDIELEDLISLNKIKKFLRSDGWCAIGIDPMRKGSSSDYKGQERRRNLKKTSKFK